MLENKLIESKRLGRDGFHWFVGQVTTDPAWRSFPADKQSRKFGYRTKVRILGKHPASNDVKDEELPWAHILVPPTSGAGVNYAGVSNFLQGGETVFGFFLDGEDGQQPVVMGALYQHSFIKDVKDWDDVLSEGTSGFSPITVDPSLTKGGSESELGSTSKPTGDSEPLRAGGIPTNDEELPIEPKGEPNPEGDEQLGESVSRYIADQPVEIRRPVKCDVPKSAMGDVAKALATFVDVVGGLEQTATGWIDKNLNKPFNIENLIDDTSLRMAGNFSGLVRRARADLFKEIDEKVGNVLTFLEPDNLIKKLELKKQKDIIYCLMENVINGLRDMIGGFMKGLLGNIINVPLCAAEQLIGSLMSSITNKIQGLIGPAMAALNGLIGGISIPDFSSIMNKATGAAQTALKLLSCEGSECEPQPFDFNINIGPEAKKILDFDRTKAISGLLSNIGIDGVDDIADAPTNLLKNAFPFLGDLGKSATKFNTLKGTTEQLAALGGSTASIVGGVSSVVDGITEVTGNCKTNILECGPPSIEFFGGGGLGAVAKAVVSSTGKVIGASMEDFGLGFDSTPAVSIVDKCRNGKGATGIAIMDGDKVVNVVITNPGDGYLPGGTLDVSDEITNESEGNQVIGEIDGIVVLNTGNNYQEGDIIETSNGGVLTPVIENGRIVGATGKADLGLSEPPSLRIKTKTGFGAFIKPITKFTPYKEYTDPIIPSAKLITVIDCPKGY